MKPPPARRLGVSFGNPTTSFAGGRLRTPAFLLPTTSGAAPLSSGTEARGNQLEAVVINRRLITEAIFSVLSFFYRGAL